MASSTLRAGPTNDNFSDAIPIETLPYSFSGTLQGATREPDEPLYPTNWPGARPETIWWSYSPTQPGVLTVDSQRVGAAAGTMVYPYRGSVLTNLELIAEAPSSFLVEPEQPYRLQLTALEGYAVPGGGFVLNVSFIPVPTNDFFSNRILLEGTNISVRSWFLDATVETGEPIPEPGIGRTLWWSWTAPEDGRVVMSPVDNGLSESANALSSIAVYAGEELPLLARISAHSPYRNSPVWDEHGPWAFGVRGGTTYHFQSWPRTGEMEKTGFDLVFSTFGPLRTDNFAQAAVLDSLHTSTVESIIGATKEPGEPSQRPGGPHKSIWWRWTATINSGDASAQASLGTLTNVTLSVYQGVTLPTLRLIATGTDIVKFPAFATETYYIAAETPQDVDGDIELLCSDGSYNSLHYQIQGNLVRNPSFEAGIETEWTPGGGSKQWWSPDGNTLAWLCGGTRIAQDIPTSPGQSYRLRFVFRNEDYISNAILRVSFGNSVVAPVSVERFQIWAPAEFVVTATSAVSRLEFLISGACVGLDQVSLLWLNDPPAIVTQPLPQTVFSGQPAAFYATIRGADPVGVQWYFNSAPIPGATTRVLSFPSVVATDAGTYQIIATNAFGSATSDPVTLTVEEVAGLQIVLHPQSARVHPGQYVGLQVAAVGTPPLSYQWHRDGFIIPGATSPILEFPSFSSADSGTYLARVSNGTESATSLPAILTLSTNGQGSGGGLIRFANVSDIAGTFKVFAPVFDVDGITPLDGSNYVAQLYAGPTLEEMQPVGPPRVFRSGFWTGSWDPFTAVLPNVAPYSTAITQSRVWDRRSGVTYEIARALGGKFGRSLPLEVVADIPRWPPPPHEGSPMIGLMSFQLQAGLPNFTTGRLDLIERRPDGVLVWRLTGAAGFRYVIERQTDGATWSPFQVLTNQAGTVTFTDDSADRPTARFYRARILD